MWHNKTGIIFNEHRLQLQLFTISLTVLQDCCQFKALMVSNYSQK